MDDAPFELHYDRSTARRLLEDTETEAVAVYCLAVNALGVDALHGDDAEMLEVYLDLEEKFGCKLPIETEAKIQAMVTLVGTDAFFDSPHAMHAISNTLSQGSIDIEEDFSIERAEWEEMHWAAFCLALVREENEEPDFDDRVLKDMILALNESGPGPEARASVASFMEERKKGLAANLAELGVPLLDIKKEFIRAEK